MRPFRARIRFANWLVVSRIPAAGLWLLDKAILYFADDCSGFGRASLVFAVEPIAYEARADSIN